MHWTAFDLELFEFPTFISDRMCNTTYLIRNIETTTAKSVCVSEIISNYNPLHLFP